MDRQRKRDCWADQNANDDHDEQIICQLNVVAFNFLWFLLRIKVFNRIIQSIKISNWKNTNVSICLQPCSCVEHANMITFELVLRTSAFSFWKWRRKMSWNMSERAHSPATLYTQCKALEYIILIHLGWCRRALTIYLSSSKILLLLLCYFE